MLELLEMFHHQNSFEIPFETRDKNHQDVALGCFWCQ
jgi:hypothetical protein